MPVVVLVKLRRGPPQVRHGSGGVECVVAADGFVVGVAVRAGAVGFCPAAAVRARSCVCWLGGDDSACNTTVPIAVATTTAARVVSQRTVAPPRRPVWRFTSREGRIIMGSPGTAILKSKSRGVLEMRIIAPCSRRSGWRKGGSSGPLPPGHCGAFCFTHAIASVRHLSNSGWLSLKRWSDALTIQSLFGSPAPLMMRCTSESGTNSSPVE